MKIYSSLLVILFSNAVLSEEPNWGEIKHKSTDIVDKLDDSDHILNIVKKVQCLYFKTHKNNVLTGQRSAVDFKSDKDDYKKLDETTSSLKNLENDYCSNNLKLNPASFSGHLLSECMQTCYKKFDTTSLNAFSSNNKQNSCVDVCNEYIAPIKEFKETISEAYNQSLIEKESKDCVANVNSENRSINKAIEIDHQIRQNIHGSSTEK